MSDNEEIKSTGVNPYDQARAYSFIIKNKLRENIFPGISNDDLYVYPLVVAPSSARIAINGAVLDQFANVGRVCICHLPKLQEVLLKTISNRNFRPSQEVQKIISDLGLLEISSMLTGLSVQELQGLRPTPETRSNLKPQNKPILKSEKIEPESIRNSLSIERTGNLMNPFLDRPWKKISVALSAVSLFVIAIVGGKYLNSVDACEIPTEIRVNNTCYKDLSRKPLRVGVLSSPAEYENFKSYLKEQLGSIALDVVIEGSSKISYAEVQNKIANKEWDIVFALSPMNGMRAKDNDYKWAACMFPQFPPTYQSAIFVKSDSSIQSLNDITAATKVALGDFNSASSFYMPIYDLYGKKMNVTAGHRVSTIIDLVSSGVVDAGAGVYTFVSDDPRFRVIHVSREIPGAGVYLSPKIQPKVEEKILQILINAPQEIKEEANYGEGDEPSYEIFRAISLRADEILGCVNFDRQPVQFFCDEQNRQRVMQNSPGLVGLITGFTNEGNGMVSLRFEEQDGGVCQLLVSLKTLSSVPNGTSPGMINRKQVRLTGVELNAGVDCNTKITDSSQIKVSVP